MWSEKQKKVMQAKIDLRHYTRELIRDVFQVTEYFPKTDPEQIGSNLRKKALSVSSLTSHGTTKLDFEEQNEDFMLVMQELRDVLKFITIAHHLRFCSDQQKFRVREAITKVINALDNLVLLQQKEE